MRIISKSLLVLALIAIVNQSPAADVETTLLDKLQVECAPALINHQIPPGMSGVEVTTSGCYCFHSQGEAQSWIASMAGEWQAGGKYAHLDIRVATAENMSRGSKYTDFFFDLDEPGEQKDVALYCFSPGQVEDYKSSLLEFSATATPE